MGGIGFGANAMEFTPKAFDKISSILDNLANATVQKTETVDKLAVALWTVIDKISQLNKIIKSLATDSKNLVKRLGPLGVLLDPWVQGWMRTHQ